VISFVYKPTGHEYLYQSECGSPYGIGEGNFYYDWLMVYGGIFPTFPEPEHGKAWLMPWKYELLHESEDSVLIAMELTDTTQFSRRPGKFNNGITGITCRVEIGVFKGRSSWDFNVFLINNKNQYVDYEYWTCNTLTPGSEIGNTGSPLNSEIIVPIEKYEAAWSPGSWIGNYGALYDYSRINTLDKWADMGIAYAHELKDNYWGVINHDNEEGIFRISDNIETPGMKFWTWGRNNIDNDLFDFSNGGADNYIELWAGVSEAFFVDAVLSPNEIKNWKETYAPTVNLNSISGISEIAAANIFWDKDKKKLFYELISFEPGSEYRIHLFLEGESYFSIVDEAIFTGPLGNTGGFYIEYVTDGDYLAKLEVYNGDNTLVLEASEEVSLSGTGIDDLISGHGEQPVLTILANNKLNLSMPERGNYEINIYNSSAQLVNHLTVNGSSIDISLNRPGVYLIHVVGEKSEYIKKIIF
jgi:hypothetical protein